MIVWLNGKMYSPKDGSIGVYLSPMDIENITNLPKNNCDSYIVGIDLDRETADKIADELKAEANKHILRPSPPKNLNT